MEQRADQGLPTKLVDEQVDLWGVSLPYWAAFNELSGQRMVGFSSVGSIRREAVTDWLNENGIFDPVEREQFRHFISLLDDEFARLSMPKESKDEKGKVS